MGLTGRREAELVRVSEHPFKERDSVYSSRSLENTPLCVALLQRAEVLISIQSVLSVLSMRCTV